MRWESPSVSPGNILYTVLIKVRWEREREVVWKLHGGQVRPEKLERSLRRAQLPKSSEACGTEERADFCEGHNCVLGAEMRGRLVLILTNY